MSQAHCWPCADGSGRVPVRRSSEPHEACAGAAHENPSQRRPRHASDRPNLHRASSRHGEKRHAQHGDMRRNRRLRCRRLPTGSSLLAPLGQSSLGLPYPASPRPNHETFCASIEGQCVIGACHRSVACAHPLRWQLGVRWLGYAPVASVAPPRVAAIECAAIVARRVWVRCKSYQGVGLADLFGSHTHRPC